MTRILVGGYSGDKGSGTGIAVVDDGAVTAVIPAESPSWIGRHPQLPVLYAVAEGDVGRVRAWSLTDDAPGQELSRGETGGAEPCHLTVDPTGRFLITVNYSGGSVSVHELEADGGVGARTDLVRHQRSGEHPRQDAAHPHMARAAGDELLVTDLGGDAIYRYQLTGDGRLETRDIVAAPPGSGPRHVLPAGDNYYVTAELSGQVLVYDADWRLTGVVPASATSGLNQPSELASNGDYLYVANRGPDTVAVFALDGTLPRYLTEIPAGDWPRHIAIDGDLLYVASERSHQVLVLRINPQTGIPALEQAIDVPSPTCVLL
jgi:6-phosphogluconolactonase